MLLHTFKLEFPQQCDVLWDIYNSSSATALAGVDLVQFIVFSTAKYQYVKQVNTTIKAMVVNFVYHH
jgi:hypothetical protein